MKVSNKPAAAAVAGGLVVLGVGLLTRLVHIQPPISPEESAAATLVISSLLYWLVPASVN